MKKYRIKPYDVVNNIYSVQRRVLFFFWTPAGVGRYADCKKVVDGLNEKIWKLN